MASVAEWLEKYEQDIQAARDNTQPEKKLKECHLAVESIVKALLVDQGIEFKPIHDTPRLAKKLPRFPTDKRRLLSYLHSVYDRRYPDDLDYTRNTTPEDAIEQVEELKKWADKHYLQ